jgi:DNA-binding winged helix-turn-helix (wHTH) protein
MQTGDRIVLGGEYSLDTARGCLLRAGEPVHLRPQAYRALKFLAEHRGHLVTKEELIRVVWDGRAVTDDSLVQCLKDVRQAFGSEGRQYLQTRRGLGYVFESGPCASVGRRESVIVAALVLLSLAAIPLAHVLRFAPEDRPQPSRVAHTAVAPQAHDDYLQGLFHHAKGRAEDVQTAIGFFNRAVTRQPDFAAAWAALATTHLSLADNSVVNPTEPLSKAKATVEKALLLDPTLAAAHVTLGDVKSSEWDWNGAEREYQLALALAPSLVRAHLAYSTYLSIIGRHSEAARVISELRDVDPLNVRLSGIEGRRLYLARRYDEAIEHLRRSIELGDKYARFYLGAAYDAQQLHHLAVEQYEGIIEHFGANPSNLVYLGYSLAKMGKRPQAQALLARITSGDAYVSPAELAILYIGLGDRERAFVALEDAYDARDVQLQWLKVEQHYDDLRDDRRFGDLELKVGLPRSASRSREGNVPRKESLK